MEIQGKYNKAKIFTDNVDSETIGQVIQLCNQKAFEGTLSAHVEDGKIPNIVLTLPKMDEYNLGYLFFFFMKACAMSAYLLEINPFDQPGVEIYKKRMFKLLGKPGVK